MFLHLLSRCAIDGRCLVFFFFLFFCSSSGFLAFGSKGLASAFNVNERAAESWLGGGGGAGPVM